jgi:exodeoxyribonuclease VII small subunit
MGKKQATFEQALKELETLAEQIERGEIGLEESIQKYEQGMKLVAQCRAILTRAEQRVQKLQPGAEADAEPTDTLDAENSETSDPPQ